MAEFVRVVSGVATQISLREFRRLAPNVSFPSNFPDDVLATYDVYRVTPVEPPPINDRTQRLVRSYIDLGTNDWHENWTIQAIPASEQDAIADARRDELFGDDRIVAIARALLSVIYDLDTRHRNNQSQPTEQQVEDAARQRARAFFRTGT